VEVSVHIEDPELHYCGYERQHKTHKGNQETCFAKLADPVGDLGVDAGEAKEAQQCEWRPQD
jgi:hypothetical protein